MTSPLLAVRDLFVDLFQRDELRMFLHLRIDPALDRCLPDGDSLELLAYRAVVALEQRGHLGPPLFAALAAERPLRAAEIHATARHVADPRAARSLAPAERDRLHAIAANLESFVRDFHDADPAAPRWSAGMQLVQQQLDELRELLALPPGHDLARTALTARNAALADAHAKSLTLWRRNQLLAETGRAALYARVCLELAA